MVSMVIWTKREWNLCARNFNLESNNGLPGIDKIKSLQHYSGIGRSYWYWLTSTTISSLKVGFSSVSADMLVLYY